jgi:GNAT superfamily N-acetyltransferase
MTLMRDLDIDVIDLPAQPMAAWLHKKAAEKVPVPVFSQPRPDESELVGRWLGLEAHQNNRFVGAVATRIYTDGSADIAPPNMAADADPSVGIAMFGHLANQLARRQVRLVTIYLPVQATVLHRCVLAAGFQRAHDLLVLATPIGRGSERMRAGTFATTDDWAVVPCQPTGQPPLSAVFARTMVGSLDFPELRMDAPVEAVLGRFAEVGPSDTRRWYLLEHLGNPAGCLLMTAWANRACCELLYMGVVPEYRGLGGGRVLLQYALWVSRELELRVLIAGVDVENDPAIAIYAAAGFDPAVRRCVFFRRLTTDDAVRLYEP